MSCMRREAVLNSVIVTSAPKTLHKSCYDHLWKEENGSDQLTAPRSLGLKLRSHTPQSSHNVSEAAAPEQHDLWIHPVNLFGYIRVANSFITTSGERWLEALPGIRFGLAAAPPEESLVTAVQPLPRATGPGSCGAVWCWQQLHLQLNSVATKETDPALR